MRDRIILNSPLEQSARWARRGGGLTLDAPNLPMVRGPKRESHGHEDFDQTSWNRRAGDPKNE